MAKKYIDADLLRKEVKGLEKSAHKFALGCADSEIRKFHEGKDYAYQHIGILIDSLQQEQQEVDLERDAVQFCFDKGLNITPYQEKTIARHFYELGKKDMKEQMLKEAVKVVRKPTAPMQYEAEIDGVVFVSQDGSDEKNCTTCDIYKMRPPIYMTMQPLCYENTCTRAHHKIVDLCAAYDLVWKKK